jgi:F-type H+-transporting ATPase subunit a
MPHGQSWFNFLPFYESVEHWLAKLSFSGDGLTVQHGPISAQHVFAFAFVLILLLVMAFIANAGLRDTKAAVIPDEKLGARTFVELLVSTAYSMMSDIMGKKAARYFLPLIGTCAFIILFSNLLGLFPGFSPPTDVLDTTLPMTLVIIVTTHIYGFKENGSGHVKHMFGPVWWLAPLFFAIELVSHFLARPLSLSIRLMANMYADHQVLSQVSGLVKWFVPVLPMLLGTLVCVVQTLVFSLLSTVYIGMAVAHTEHDDHAEAH